MIKVIKEGVYKLIETKGQTKMLILDRGLAYAWINATEIGEILIESRKTHETDCVLAMGKYRIIDVKDEPNLTDLWHLELFVGEGFWQGYLLPTGLPNSSDKRKRIIPTTEIITKTTH